MASTINALKHAFPDIDKSDRQIAVRFEVAGSNWKLSVEDNGMVHRLASSLRRNPA
jgi:two-component sensor histidine kinase